MSLCKYCHEQIVWRRNDESKWKALNEDGSPHHCKTPDVRRVVKNLKPFLEEYVMDPVVREAYLRNIEMSRLASAPTD